MQIFRAGYAHGEFQDMHLKLTNEPGGKNNIATLNHYVNKHNFVSIMNTKVNELS